MKFPDRRSRRRGPLRSPRRSGLTIIPVLACLILVALVSGVLLRIGVSYREQSRRQERALQAEWLANAGVERALARLAARASYSGETWEIDPASLGLTVSESNTSASAARVLIQVKPAAADRNACVITVQADHPPDPLRRVRHTKQVVVELGVTDPGDSQ